MKWSNASAWSLDAVMIWEGWATIGVWGGALAVAIALVTFIQRNWTASRVQARLVFALADTEKIATGADLLDELKSARPKASSVPNEATKAVADNDGLLRGEIVAPGPMRRCIVTVHNKSEELIGPVEVDVLDPAGDSMLADRPCSLRFIPPGESHDCYAYWLLDDPKIFIQTHVKIYFRDAVGRWWSREASEPVKRKRRWRVPKRLRKQTHRRYKAGGHYVEVGPGAYMWRESPSADNQQEAS